MPFLKFVVVTIFDILNRSYVGQFFEAVKYNLFVLFCFQAWKYSTNNRFLIDDH
ncbi:hypothetical protein BCR42DRAFT_412648 [Absidia repens]|uniref:Uncharacterized protein n=1 Tax=Absidia repens TaxID=90262 RepID=A0A1X2IJW6_9FUNG|nr:hypothetical protein BCR42DRAFT_412648 [Absidia repens]